MKIDFQFLFLKNYYKLLYNSDYHQLPSTTLSQFVDSRFQKSCDTQINNVHTLENIQIPNLQMENDKFMDHESLSISSIEDEFKIVSNKKLITNKYYLFTLED